MASKLADRLEELADREFPEKRGRALRALSLKCGLSEKAIYTLVTRLRESGSEDGGDLRTFRLLAEHTGCRLDWLTRGESPMYLTPSADALNYVLDERPWPAWVVKAAMREEPDSANWTVEEWRGFMLRVAAAAHDPEHTAIRKKLGARRGR